MGRFSAARWRAPVFSNEDITSRKSSSPALARSSSRDIARLWRSLSAQDECSDGVGQFLQKVIAELLIHCSGPDRMSEEDFQVHLVVGEVHPPGVVQGIRIDPASA